MSWVRSGRISSAVDIKIGANTRKIGRGTKLSLFRLEGVKFSESRRSRLGKIWVKGDGRQSVRRVAVVSVKRHGGVSVVKQRRLEIVVCVDQPNRPA